MALQLHCKRAKIFMNHGSKTGKRTVRVVCPRGEVTTVPDWVKDDPGYAAGIKDGSIVNLTPGGGLQSAESALAAENAKLKAELANLKAGLPEAGKDDSAGEAGYEGTSAESSTADDDVPPRDVPPSDAAVIDHMVDAASKKSAKARAAKGLQAR